MSTYDNGAIETPEWSLPKPPAPTAPIEDHLIRGEN